MIIHIDECMASDCTILKVLPHYKTINKLLEEAFAEDAYFPYLDVGIKFKGVWHPLRTAGITNVTQNEKTFKELKKLPSRIRRIPNDTMIIKCDESERELFINLDGQ